MKKGIALLLVAGMLISLAGCGEAETQEQAAEGGDAKTIYYVGPAAGGVVWGDAQKGFETACDELGWEGYYVAPTTEGNTAEMANLMETAITNKADALIGLFMDTSIFGDIAEKAKADGIYLGSTNCYMDGIDFWIGTDPVGMGETQAKTLVELAGDQEVTVLYLQTNATGITQNMQYEAFSEYLKDYPNITVFGQDFVENGMAYDATIASDKILNLRKVNPELNAVVCADSTGALGVANYVEENQLEDEMIVVGIDGAPDILNYVTSGALDCTIAQDFYKMGYESVYMMNDLMNGKEIAFDNESGTIVVNADTVEEYAAEMELDLSGGNEGSPCREPDDGRSEMQGVTV